MTVREIAERVMQEHGMTSLDAFGERMTMGEMRRMLEHAATLAREPESTTPEEAARLAKQARTIADMWADPAEPGRLFP
jgi:hypothetical protein